MEMPKQVCKWTIHAVSSHLLAAAHHGTPCIVVSSLGNGRRWFGVKEGHDQPLSYNAVGA